MSDDDEPRLAPGILGRARCAWIVYLDSVLHGHPAVVQEGDKAMQQACGELRHAARVFGCDPHKEDPTCHD